MYRVLHVKRVTYTKDYMDVEFDNSSISFVFVKHSHGFVDRLWNNVFPGTNLLIRSEKGIDDADLWGMGTVDDARVI